MSTEGRVIIDALFYDRDGTVSINVVSLNNTVAVNGGEVAVSEGIASVDPVLANGSGYRDASGELVVFNEHHLFAVAATGTISITSVAAGDGLTNVTVTDGVAVIQNPSGGGIDGLYVSTYSGTARYSIMFIGQ